MATRTAQIAKLEQVLEDINVDLQGLRVLRRYNLVSKKQFELQKKRLTTKEANLEDRLVGLLKAEEEKKKKAAKALAKKTAERTTIRNATNVLFEQRVPPNQIMVILVAAYQATSGVGDMIAITVVETDIGKDNEVRLVEIPQIHNVTNYTGMTSKAFIEQWTRLVGSDKLHLIRKITLIRPTAIKPKLLLQTFRDGISHCVFTPLINHHTAVISGRACADTKRQSKKCIEKLNEMAIVYDAGVPEDKMEEVAKAARVQLAIRDVLGNVLKEYNVANNRKCLHFTNTRANHIDKGFLALDEKGIRVSQEALDATISEWNDNGTFYCLHGDPFNPSKIRSLTQCFYVENSEKVLFDDMDNMIGLKNIRLNATRYPEVNKFIKQGRIINSWCVSLSDDEPTGQIDMSKAYTQFKKCSYYTGFLGMIQEFRSGSFDADWIRQHIGLYKITVSVVPERFKVLGLSGTHILPSPEILYMLDNGVEMEITQGVFGSRFDFEFPSDMLEHRRYCKWAGRLGMEMTDREYTFKCDQKWAEHLAAQFPKCRYIDGLCTIKLPNTTVFTAHHVLAFITSYTRITMMETMKQFTGKVCRVVLDGIYYTGEAPKSEIFKEKEIVAIPDEIEKGLGWYNMYEINEYDFPPVFVKGNTLFTGQGGCGKTYSVMSDKGFNNVLFVSPLHVLGQDVKEKYGNSYTTIHKLLGKAGDEQCAMFKDEKFYPPVIYVDEVTQIPTEWIAEIFDKYKLSLILLGGDIDDKQWYQCRNGTPGNFSKVWLGKEEIRNYQKSIMNRRDASMTNDYDLIHRIHNDGDRRSKDEKLKQLKIDIRAEMKRIFIDGDSGENEQMIAWAFNNLPTINLVQAIEMFKEGDHFIAATHRINTALLAGGVCTGWYKSGGHISYTEVEGYEKRGSFTIHSFQGKTVENGKIFVSLSDMFEYSMLYTAVSRATQFEQLYFIA